MGVNITERETRALAALEQVGLSDAALLYPSQLSGGMKMRVSLARALINEPELLLLDEPFAALDETTRFYLAEKLSELWTKRKMTVIFVTHSILDAVFLSESVIILGPKPIQKVKEISIALPQPRNYALRSDSRYHEWTNKISKAFHEISPLSFEANPPIVFRDGLT
jgi:NitT/TauT family transport system ATP-binding protein